MNLGDIEKEYPKAFQILKDSNVSVESGDKNELRKLFEFFDSVGIYISVSVYKIGATYEINFGRETIFSGIKQVKREEIEELSFQKAFKILNNGVKLF